MYLEKYKGLECSVKIREWGGEIKGIVVEVEDNWVKLSTNKKVMILNSRYIQYIKIKENN